MKRQACLALLFATASLPHPASADNARASGAERWQAPKILALAEKVADYQLATMAGGYVPPNTSPDTPDPYGWVQGALFVGLTEIADRSKKPSYRQAVLARGLANKWQLGKRVYHADDHVIAASYLWATRHGAGPEALAPVRERFDTILSFPSNVTLEHAEYSDPRGVTCSQRWCWCDAIFMAPPVWIELSQATGDWRYAEFAKKEFAATTSYLYDAEEHLYYRDSRFFERRGPDGEKVFWSRGNGWVFAGLARMIPHLPPQDPGRAQMERVFKQMAAKLKAIQKQDGYWSPSLLSNPNKSLPESSGTGFFTYGFAWGIKSGLLKRAEYEDTVRNGWAALTRAVHDDGKLGYVQPVSDRPDDVSYDDTQFYGVGAFLLAATAVADLDLH